MPEARILIVSKTRMKNGCCVGGITTKGKSVRLMTDTGGNQEHDSPYEIGDIWQIDYENPSTIEPPHVEDIHVTNAEKDEEKSGQSSIPDILDTLGIELWQGDISCLYGGMLNFTSSNICSAYIVKENLPDRSTWFWIPDKNLELYETNYDNKTKKYYRYQSREYDVKIPYVGFETLIDKISVGTIIRISLARKIPFDGHFYLQLSGWY